MSLNSCRNLDEGNGVVASREPAQAQLVPRLAFQSSFYQGLCALVALIGKLDSIHRSICRLWVDKHVAAALSELLPFEIRGDLLPLANHVGVDELGLLGLTSNELVKKDHGLLHNLDYVGFEVYKVILYRNEVVLMVVLLNDLFVESVVDAPVNHIWVKVRLHPSASRIMTRSLLPEKLNVLLGCVTGLLDFLCALHSAGLEILCLGLDLLVQTVEDGENIGLDIPFGLEVGV